MKKLILPLLLVSTQIFMQNAFAASACDSRSGNCLSIQQVGNTSFSDVSQYGEGNLATTFQKSRQTEPVPFWNRSLATTIYQDGDKNIAHVTQYSGEGKGEGNAQRAGITQVGDRNETTISSGEDTGRQGGMAIVSQYGNDNIARITQVAKGTLGTIYQEGNKNNASINTRSHPNNETHFVNITQVGNHNNAESTSLDGSWAHSIINQSGDHNHGSQYVENPYNQVRLQQIGNNNTSYQTVRSRSSSKHTDVLNMVTQQGNGNLSSIEASGDRANSFVEQYGNRNKSGLNNNGNDYGTAKIAQTGDDNTANATINGASNNVDIAQNGNGNIAGVLVNGAGNTAIISQLGNNNQAYQTINGSGNHLAIYQQGSGNYASQSITGNSNALSISQVGSGNNGTIDWQGNNSNLSISQTGSNLSYSIIGQGDGRQMAITQSN